MDKPMDHEILTQFLFYPRPISESEIPPSEHGTVHRYESGNGEKISAYLYRSLPDAPTALFFHGNGEVLSDYAGDLTMMFSRIGVNLCVVDYRGYGLSEGAPSLSKILEDGRATWDYFTGEVGIAPEDIILFGRSMGSIPAIDLASSVDNKFKCLIVESGISGFERWIERLEPMIKQLGMDIDALKADLRKNLDHKAKIDKVEKPILILHTERDSIVPSWNARDLYEWAGPEKAKIKIFERGDHNSIFYYNGDKYLEIVRNFMA